MTWHTLVASPLLQPTEVHQYPVPTTSRPRAAAGLRYQSLRCAWTRTCFSKCLEPPLLVCWCCDRHVWACIVLYHIVPTIVDTTKLKQFFLITVGATVSDLLDRPRVHVAPHPPLHPHMRCASAAIPRRLGLRLILAALEFRVGALIPCDPSGSADFGNGDQCYTTLPKIVR